MELQKNDLVELVVESLGIDGEGVARAEGKTVFIKGALPGEKVRAKIIGVKPRYNFALLERVLVPSADRVVPACPHFGKCGGCDLMHLSYSAQLDYKRNLVRDTLKRVGGIEAEVNPTVPSPLELRYRNKLSLPVRKSKDGIAIGLFAKSSHRVVQTTDCLLQYEWNTSLIAAVRAFMEREGVAPYDEESGKGVVRHIVAREAGGLTTVTLVCTRDIDCKALDLSFLGRHALFVNINRRRDNVILGDEWIKKTDGDETVMVEGLKTKIHPAAFFQVNDGIRERLYSDAAAHANGKSAIEAFSGAGLLSARLCKTADEVFGIEINAQAHHSALTLKKQNGLVSFTPVLGDVGERLGEVIARCRTKPFIILDPPRSGVSERAIEDLCRFGADSIVYISCNPATLARDLKKFTELGYAVTSATPYDMFPQTANVETLVCLTKN